MRLLALDYGDRFTGLALGEKPNLLELPAIETKNSSYLILEIKKVVESENVEALVIGIPNNPNSKQKNKTELFISQIEKDLKLPIYKVDETGTSKESFSELFTKHSAIKKIKKKVHSSSAAKILVRHWLDEGDSLPKSF